MLKGLLVTGISLFSKQKDKVYQTGNSALLIFTLLKFSDVNIVSNFFQKEKKKNLRAEIEILTLRG